MKRREMLVIPARTLGGVLLYTLAKEPIRLNAQGDAKVPLRFFTAAEARAVEAAAARILPSDETGPGAREAGAVIYIDRQLAGPYGRDKYRYTKGPWIASVPEHGNQSRESPRDIYREGITLLGVDFDLLTAAEQDAKLQSIETTGFFELLRTHTLEGTFCDPLHGGNKGMIGWQLIGYPGPLMSYRDSIAKYQGIPYPRTVPKSLEQLTGRKIKGSEDEA